MSLPKTKSSALCSILFLILTISGVNLVSVWSSGSSAFAACIDNPTDAIPLTAGAYTGGQMFSIAVTLNESIKVKIPENGDDIYMILYGPLFEDRVCEVARGNNIEGPGTKTLTYKFTFGEVWYLEVYGFGTINEYQLEVTMTKDEEPEKIEPTIELTYPAGQSPKVFTDGWVFGAKCTYTNDEGKEVDISDQVSWSGTGTFKPERGSRSYPSFNNPDTAGQHTIELSIDINGETYKKEFKVEAVPVLGYASLSDISVNPADAHGAPPDPMPARGPIITGSTNVSINGKPAARVGDSGIHATCTGPNLILAILTGDENVVIDGRPAARYGDQTAHCGGYGRIITASPGSHLKSILTSQKRGAQTDSIPNSVVHLSSNGGTISGKVTDSQGAGLLGVGITVYGDTNIDVWGTITDENGEYQVTDLSDDKYHIYFWGGNWAYNDGYFSSWYSNKSSLNTADTITITEGEIVTDIDAILPAGGSISGTVKDASGSGVEKAIVGAYGESGGMSFGYTDKSGAFQIAGLESDNYRVYCDAGLLGHISEWYNSRSSQGSADPVTVTAPNQVSGIDFSLDSGGAISGTVRKSDGNGIADIYVKVFGNTTGTTAMGITNADGDYTVNGLVNDFYRILHHGEAKGYDNKWYNGKLAWDNANMVEIKDKGQITGIDIVLNLIDDGEDSDSGGGGGGSGGGGGGGGGCLIECLIN